MARSLHGPRSLKGGVLVATPFLAFLACCKGGSSAGIPATGTGRASLTCSAGDAYKNVTLARQFQSLATCQRRADQSLLVRVDSDTCDNVSFVIGGYHGPGTYSGYVEVYTVDPGTACHQGIAVATTVPADADACPGAPPAPCSVTIQGTATTAASGTLTLSASCTSFSFSREGTCGTCTAQDAITAAIEDCDLRGPAP